MFGDIYVVYGLGGGRSCCGPWGSRRRIGSVMPSTPGRYCTVLYLDWRLRGSEWSLDGGGCRR